MAVTTAPARPVVANDVGPRYLEWGPIILGALGALAIMVVLLTFGAALGLSVVSPYPYAGLSGTVLAILAALYGALAHVASFSAGGYLAGRMRSPWAAGDGVEQQFRDGSHGFAVWALGVPPNAELGFRLAAIGAGERHASCRGHSAALARSIAMASIQRRPSCHSRNTRIGRTSSAIWANWQACSNVASSWAMMAIGPTSLSCSRCLTRLARATTLSSLKVVTSLSKNISLA